jgi:hypothetical protein
MKWYEYIIISIALTGALHLGLTIRAESKAKDYTVAGVHLELIAVSDDGDVKYYRLADIGNAICYITVGELHGKTVAMECK